MKILEAVISISIQDERVRESLVEALKPDNKYTPPNVSIQGKNKGREIIFELRGFNLLGSLISTADDMLACLEVAYKTIGSLSL